MDTTYTLYRKGNETGIVTYVAVEKRHISDEHGFKNFAIIGNIKKENIPNNARSVNNGNAFMWQRDEYNMSLNDIRQSLGL